MSIDKTIAMENGPAIVDLPIKDCDFSTVSYVSLPEANYWDGSSLHVNPHNQEKHERGTKLGCVLHASLGMISSSFDLHLSLDECSVWHSILTY